MKPLWAHQERGLAELEAKVAPGARLCLTAPTGAGKSRMMLEIILWAVAKGKRVLLLTNRRMLLRQIHGNMTEAGIPCGIIAAGYEPEKAPVQIATVQTLARRGFKKGVAIHVPDADIVLTDEAHAIKEAQAVMIYGAYENACKIGVTATPLDIGHLYDQLIVAGKPSELRGCGTLVPAVYYAPDEPDTRRLTRTKTGEYAEGDVVKAIMSATICGRVIDNWRRLNPRRKPTILFAPGVKESQWFAEKLTEAGIPAAHIDGNQLWCDGLHYPSNDDNRDIIAAKLREGEIKVLCNRFVLREGIDLPFVEHIICATIFGSIGTYIQSVGRGLRACPDTGKQRCVIQDHGGNWHRLGSVNADRDWELSDSAYIIGETREDRLKTKKEVEPIQCPKCNMVRASGPACPGCGYQHTTRSRMVVQRDGSLKPVNGDIYHEPVYDKRTIAEDLWLRSFWAVRAMGGTFRQARGHYCYKNGWVFPPNGLPGMPRNERDWFRPIKDVPLNELVPLPERKKRENLYA